MIRNRDLSDPSLKEYLPGTTENQVDIQLRGLGSVSEYEPPNPNRRIRVLLVITRLTIGGDTNVVLDIASYLNRHPDFEVQLAVGPVPEDEVDLTHWAYQRAIPTRMMPHLVNHMNPLLNLRAFLELRSLIDREKFDIVHTHSSVAGVIGRLAAVTARVPVIVHHVHGWGLQEDMSAAMRIMYLSLERICASFTSRMIAVSRPTIQKGLDYHICPEDKFALIYNGIHLEDFRQKIEEREVRLELGLNPDHKVVGMIGRLDRQKNPLDFIRAAALVVKSYPNTQFLIAGEGPLRSECEKSIDELNLRGRFFLLGFRNDIWRILPALNLIVSSSLWEGLPVVFQEAMSAGKPIIANDVDGASDVVINGETGCLVTPHQPSEMAERIILLLNNDSLCDEMGLKAQQFSERFTSEGMLERVAALYKKLMQSGS